MRAFVAVVPPPEALAPLAGVVESLRAPGASWVHADRLHLTLAFLGNVEDHLASRVAVALRDAVTPVRPFGLSVRGGGAFPRPARPRVLWAGVDGDVEALRGLARVVRRACRGAGADVERTPYRPHVTVARVRADGYAAGVALAALDAVRGPAFDVTEVLLMSSRLGPDPSYDVVARAPLGQA